MHRRNAGFIALPVIKYCLKTLLKLCKIYGIEMRGFLVLSAKMWESKWVSEKESVARCCFILLPSLKFLLETVWQHWTRRRVGLIVTFNLRVFLWSAHFFINIISPIVRYNIKLCLCKLWMLRCVNYGSYGKISHGGWTVPTIIDQLVFNDSARR